MNILTNQQGPGPDAWSPLQMEAGTGACLHLHIHPWNVLPQLATGDWGAGEGQTDSWRPRATANRQEPSSSPEQEARLPTSKAHTGSGTSQPVLTAVSVVRQIT